MKKKRKKERWKPRGTQKNNQNQTRRRKHRQLRESVRERGEIQPIRDEMELLESERRIFIPGCCTEKREKRERGKKKRKGIKRNWGSCTMQYYVFYLRKNEQREAEERTCVYTEIKRDEIRWWWRLSPLGSTEDGLGGKWQIGEERWRQGERNTTPRSTTITPTSLEENTG